MKYIRWIVPVSITAAALAILLAAPVGARVMVYNAGEVTLTGAQKTKLAAAVNATFPGIAAAALDSVHCTVYAKPRGGVGLGCFGVDDKSGTKADFFDSLDAGGKPRGAPTCVANDCDWSILHEQSDASNAAKLAWKDFLEAAWSAGSVLSTEAVTWKCHRNADTPSQIDCEAWIRRTLNDDDAMTKYQAGAKYEGNVQ